MNRVKRLLKYFNGNINATKEFKLLVNVETFEIPNVSKNAPIAYGSTTLIFDSIVENRVIGATFDILKCYYMKSLNKDLFVDFKIVEIREYEKDKFIIFFDMEKLETLKGYNYELYEEFYAAASDFDYSEHITDEMYEAICDFNVMTLHEDILDLISRKTYLPEYLIDIHEDQLMVKEDKIYCFDFFIPINLSRGIGN